uniref:Peptidase M43 pregnancy-associated plasma-A domain-containing protein n=1 Tax=Psilocybe cubensis TaxID=181762 RepID=A0A8H7YBS7_PSICU
MNPRNLPVVPISLSGHFASNSPQSCVPANSLHAVSTSQTVTICSDTTPASTWGIKTTSMRREGRIPAGVLAPGFGLCRIAVHGAKDPPLHQYVQSDNARNLFNHGVMLTACLREQRQIWFSTFRELQPYNHQLSGHDLQIAVLNRDFNSKGNEIYLETVAMQTEMKQKLRKGGPETLNVYTVGFHNTQAEGLLGYATFPTDYKSLPKDDGVVIQYGTLPGGNLAPFNKGKTLTHEVGHWVGLYHTFEGGSCSSSGDEVSDTPAQLKPTSGCPIANPDTCPGKAGLDPIRALISIAFKFYGNNGSDRQLYGLLG